jgi:hypothetical protein
MTATIRTSEVAALLRLRSAAAARVQLARWKLDAVGRDTATGEKLWPKDLVEELAAIPKRPGYRSDLKPGKDIDG